MAGKKAETHILRVFASPSKSQGKGKPTLDEVAKLKALDSINVEDTNFTSITYIEGDYNGVTGLWVTGTWAESNEDALDEIELILDDKSETEVRKLALASLKDKHTAGLREGLSSVVGLTETSDLTRERSGEIKDLLSIMTLTDKQTAKASTRGMFEMGMKYTEMIEKGEIEAPK